MRARLVKRIVEGILTLTLLGLSEFLKVFSFFLFRARVRVIEVVIRFVSGFVKFFRFLKSFSGFVYHR